MNANASTTLKLEGAGVAPTLFSLGIDVLAKDSAKLIARLAKLDSVVSVVFGGVYREDPTYAQVHVETFMTEDELDHWLWATKHGCDYVGVFQR